MNARGVMLVALLMLVGCRSNRPVAPEVPAGHFSPRATAAILDGPGGRLELRTGDVAFRLDRDAGLERGVCPLPLARRRTDGMVQSMRGPGSRSWADYRRWFARPERRALVRELLGDLWLQIPEDVREDLTTAATPHPFTEVGGAAETVFLTVLDRWIDSVVDAEVVGTRIDEEWTTVPTGLPPQVSTEEGTRGELVILTADQVKKMRGRDVADLEASAVAGPGYRPGSAHFSDVGLVAIERVRNARGRLMRRAFVYAARPGAGIRRYTMHEFFGAEAASHGAVFRYVGDEAIAQEAARELVDLYRQRESRKVLRGTPETDVDLRRETLMGHRDTAPPLGRARAWDSWDYAHDWRNQVRYSSGELVWAHFARHGVQLLDSLSIVTRPLDEGSARDDGTQGVHLRVTPQSLALADSLRRIVDFDSAHFDGRLRGYSTHGNVQPLGALEVSGRDRAVIRIY